MPASASPPPTPPPITEKAGERWVRIKAVFGEALEVPESERSAFVARACEGDVTLRMEIESLLTNEKAAVGFLETPAVGLLAQGAPASPRLEPGTRLGAYEITAFLSAAGMGEVYRARHTVLGRQVVSRSSRVRFALDLRSPMRSSTRIDTASYTASGSGRSIRTSNASWSSASLPA